MKFSERFGFAAPKTVLQKNSIDNELKNMLWESVNNYVFNSPYLEENISRLWVDFFKNPSDTIETNTDMLGRHVSFSPTISKIRRWFFSDAKFFQIYDIIEFCCDSCSIYEGNYKFVDTCNKYLEQEKSAYRIIDGIVSSIIDDHEIEEIENATSQKDRYSGARNHIRTALQLYSNKREPDYRNSIKEAISAVESVACILTGDKAATLGTALKAVQKKSEIHPAMIEAFGKLYGYTSDEGGIRHAMMEEARITESEARFMIVACSAFVNFLIVSGET